MKKIIASIFIILAATLVLVACTGNKKVNSNVKEEELFAVSAVTAVSDINLQLGNPLLTMSLDEDIHNKEYLDLMLNLLNDESFSSILLESDNDDYTNLLVITINKEVFNFYYNEILVKDESDLDDDEEETEQEYKIIGIINNNEITYEVNGKKSIESEIDSKGNKEEELELEFKIMLDSNNYSVVKYEFENELDDNETELEKELKFTTYKDNKKVSELSIELEFEGNTKEIELKLKESNKTTLYKFHSNKDNTASIKFVIKEKDLETLKGIIEVVLVTTEDGVTKYQYK